MDLTSDQAAKPLRITGGFLRMIETNKRPVSLRLAHRASRFYDVPVDELLADDEPKPQPDRPRPKPKVEPVGPPKRRNGNDDRRGPKRAADEAEAVA